MSYVAENEVLINGVSFPLHGAIKPSLINMFPPKVTIGDTTKDDEQFMASQIQNDVLAGIGLWRITDKSQTERAWVSYLNMAYKSGLTLPQYVANYGHPTGTNSAIIGGIDYNGSHYIVIGNSVYEVNASPVEGYQKIGNPTTAPTLTAQAGSTGLTGGNVTVGYTWTTPSGETQIGPTQVVTITAGQQILVTLPPLVSGATGLNLYWSQTVGSGTLGKGVALTTTSYTITALPSATQPPATNTSGVDNFGSGAVFTADKTITDFVVWGGYLWCLTADQIVAYNGTIAVVDSSPGTGGGSCLVVHDNKLWRFNNGTIYQLAQVNAGTWLLNSATITADVTVEQLIEYRDALGDPTIYAITSQGAYTLDESTAPPIWQKTEFTWPKYSTSQVSTVWRGDMLVFSGLDGYRFTQGNPSTVDAGIGLSKDDGVPVELDGAVEATTTAFNDLFVMVNQASASQITEAPSNTKVAVPFSIRDPQFNVIPSYQNYIAQWNGSGWQIPWVSPTSIAGTIPPGRMWVSTANTYRLYWSWNGMLWGLDLYPGVRNPWQNKIFKYQPSAYMITPWFQGMAESLPKVAAALKVYALNTSSTETITVWYGTDFSEAWHALPDDSAPGNVINTNGLTVIPIGTPTITTAKTVYEGVPFEAIRFKFELDRGSNNTLSPALLYWMFQFQKFSPPRWGYNVQLDLTDDYRGNTPAQLINQLNTIINSTPFVILQWRDGGSSVPSIAAVKVTHLGGTAQVGFDYRGVWQMSCIEPIQF